MSDKSQQPDGSGVGGSAAKSHFSGRFSEPVTDLVKRFTASVSFDKRLAFVDIQGSLAHARMLARQGVIAARDLADIERGMAEILAEIQAGRFDWRVDLEDVHMNIESRLIAAIGDAGKRLHTGRSRNDQIATDIRLWLRVKSTVWSNCCGHCNLRWWALRKNMPKRSCRVLRTFRLHNR